MSTIKWSAIKQIEVFFFETNVMMRRFVSCPANGILCLTRRVAFMSYGTSGVYVLRDESNGTSGVYVLRDEWRLCPTGRVLRDEWRLCPTGRVQRDEWRLSKPEGEFFSKTECDGRGF